MVWLCRAVKGKTASCVLLGHPRAVSGGALVLCWAWEERIKGREIKPCLHLFRSVQSFNKAAEGSPSFLTYFPR